MNRAVLIRPMAYRGAVLNAFTLFMILSSGIYITHSINDEARESAPMKQESDRMFDHGTYDSAKHSANKLIVREGIKYS